MEKHQAECAEAQRPDAEGVDESPYVVVDGRKSQRKIKAAIVGGFDPEDPWSAEVIPIKSLMRRSRPEIEDFKLQASHSAKDSATSPLSCYCCQEPVYISWSGRGNQQRPVFVHFDGYGRNCPWITRKPKSQNQIQASIFLGKQTSERHDRLVKMLENVCLFDSDIAEVHREIYFKPDGERYGKYPDILIELVDGRKFALEVQLAPAQNSLIMSRRLFYVRNNVNLIWLLDEDDWDCEVNPFTSFRTISIEHSGNFFLVDDSILQQSRDRGFLQFWNRPVISEQVQDRRLAILDDLVCSDQVLPFIDDNHSQEILEKYRSRRCSLMGIFVDGNGDFIKAIHNHDLGFLDAASEFLEIGVVSDLRSMEYRLKDFCATVCTVMNSLEGQRDRFENFRDETNSLTAMLNAYVSKSSNRSAVPVVVELVQSLHLVERGSVKPTFWDVSSRGGVGHGDQETVVFRSAASEMVPEIFDKSTRATLSARKSTPWWAIPPH